MLRNGGFRLATGGKAGGAPACSGDTESWGRSALLLAESKNSWQILHVLAMLDCY